MTDKQRRWYEDKLAMFASSHGMRYELVTSMTYAAAACGLTHDDVIADCRAAMPDFTSKHAADIRRGMASAYEKVKSRPFTGARQPVAQPVVFPDKVKECIKAGGMKARLDDLVRVSGQGVALLGVNEQMRRFLRTLYKPDDLLHIESSARREVARLGIDLMTRDAWIDRIMHIYLGQRDCIGRNPYTGEMGVTGEGKPSLTASSCVAAFRYVLVEFDHLPLEEQAAFWLGFLQTMPNLAPLLVSLTYSGGKSIHGLLRVDADRQDAPRVAHHLRSLFCADPERHTRTYDDGKEAEIYPFRADPMGFTLRGGTRLAGAIRTDNNAHQQLLYLKV